LHPTHDHTFIRVRDDEGKIMNYRNQGEDRGEHGRGEYRRRSGNAGGGKERAPWDERGAERGSYSSRHGFQGEQDLEGNGRGAGDWRGDWREDFRGPRGGWDDGRVSMEPRGSWRSSSDEEGSRYGSRGETARGSDTTSWRGSEGSSMGEYGRTTGYGGQGTGYGGMGARPNEGRSAGEWRGDSRSYPSQYESRGTRGGFGDDAAREHEWRRGSQRYGSDSGNGEPWAAGRRWATENAGRAGSDLGFGGEGLGSHSWGPQSFGSNPGWASRAFESSSGNYADTDRGRHFGKGPKNYRRNDDRIKEDVSERLKEHGEIDASDIEVEVSSGTVTLSGEVRNRREKRLAEDAIEGVSGVEDVTNQLRVRSRNERENAERDEPNGHTSSSGASTRSSSKSSPTGVGTLGQSMSAASHIEKGTQSKGRSIGSPNES
jgi:hypothetical protein